MRIVIKVPWIYFIVLVEVLRVHFILDIGNEGGPGRAQANPVHPMEEWVALDLAQAQSVLLVTD